MAGSKVLAFATVALAFCAVTGALAKLATDYTPEEVNENFGKLNE